MVTVFVNSLFNQASASKNLDKKSYSEQGVEQSVCSRNPLETQIFSQKSS